jgi:hypothetical protein
MCIYLFSTKASNIIIAGAWMDRKKPLMTPFLKSVFAQFKELFEKGKLIHC